ncbi:MAG TPA: Type 1 glutamine amidotransferase-like domain-containing protein, partial [Patescibacteria group bacterium]|nr:Type 1 glutamine amidotransferase-like domain-containing protein [Patescibacteria group bacterium]
MKKLIAIGGGEIGRPGYPVETLAIDKEIIRLSGKRRPRLLFIPTASHDAPGYIETVRKHFGRRLGCLIDILLIAKTTPAKKFLQKKVSKADIIYVGGGNSLYMLKRWRKLGLDRLLTQAYAKGTVMAGLSAGAICWFAYGNSDSLKLTKPGRKNYIRVKGLGWLNLTLSPHHLRERDRKDGLIKILKSRGGIGLALDDYAAIEILDGNFRIITSKPF